MAGWEVQDENLSNREKLGAGECAQVHVVPASGYLVLERDAPCGISFGARRLLVPLESE